MMNIEWQWSTFSSLSGSDIYEMLKVRQQVFVLEQHCLYGDIDDADQESRHLLGWDSDPHSPTSRRLCAYLRVRSPRVLGGISNNIEPSMGRVLVVEEYRNQGLGKQLLERGIQLTHEEYPHHAIKISAQVYLHHFYQKMGFEVISRPYNEDGIPHIDMRLNMSETLLVTT